MMLVVAMLSIVSVMAVERTVVYKSNDFTVLINQAKYDEAKAYLDSCIIDTQDLKSSIVRGYYNVEHRKNGKLATPELVLAKVQENSNLVGLTDSDLLLLTKVTYLYWCGFNTEAIALGKDSQGKQVKAFMYYPYLANKEYEKAYEAAMFANNKLNAFLVLCKFDKVRAFELAKQLTLNTYVTHAVLAQVLDKLSTFNFRDSAVTKDMEIAFLADLNEKYSRFLITDKVAWEPVIALIRLSLEVKRSSK